MFSSYRLLPLPRPVAAARKLPHVPASCAPPLQKRAMSQFWGGWGCGRAEFLEQISLLGWGMRRFTSAKGGSRWGALEVWVGVYCRDAVRRFLTLRNLKNGAGGGYFEAGFLSRSSE